MATMTIIAATDFSESARAAVERAALIARARGSIEAGLRIRRDGLGESAFFRHAKEKSVPRSAARARLEGDP
jgi:hypothetical protein